MGTYFVFAYCFTVLLDTIVFDSANSLNFAFFFDWLAKMRMIFNLQANRTTVYPFKHGLLCVYA